MAVAKHTRRKRGKDGVQSVCEQFRIESKPRGGRLQKASAVLIALVYSLSQGLDNEQAGDVASVALDLVEQAILALDVVELRKAR